MYPEITCHYITEIACYLNWCGGGHIFLQQFMHLVGGGRSHHYLHTCLRLWHNEGGVVIILHYSKSPSPPGTNNDLS